MSPILYWTLLIFTCGYAFYRGGRYERLVALVCLAGTVATISVDTPLAERYVDFEGSVLMVDLFVLSAFVTIALYSDRFWPLWVAGLQLTTSIAHFLKAVQPDLIPQAYGIALRFWSYPILIILIVGTWRAHQRRLREQAIAAPA
ncbi:MAG TPA: hypothetical protein VM346_04755 [Sphingomicrobium sp.]|nr:hypothetical protein [Sphingomicrobium sp.]